MGLGEGLLGEGAKIPGPLPQTFILAPRSPHCPTNCPQAAAMSGPRLSRMNTG